MSDLQPPAEAELKGVGLTALVVAQARAIESQRPDRLFDDPYAASFVERAGPSFVAAAAELAPKLKLRGNGSYFAIRTRYFDDFLLESVRSGCRQMVLLGTGLDTRAFRLDLAAEVDLFELDLADVHAFKDEVLGARSAEPTCRRVVVPADLRGEWSGALVSAGFRPALPTAWLAEGILMYLTEGERDRLLESIGELSADGSRLGLEQRGVASISHTDSPRGSIGADTGTDPVVAREQANAAGEAMAERFGVRTSAERPDPSMTHPGTWLGRHGWRASVSGAADCFASYGRPVPEVLRAGAVQDLASTCRAQLSDLA